jgi:hypothetical protein
MTVYSPKGKNTGAAMVVFPGGGYENLGIDLEAWRCICMRGAGMPLGCGAPIFL